MCDNPKRHWHGTDSRGTSLTLRGGACKTRTHRRLLTGRVLPGWAPENVNYIGNEHSCNYLLICIFCLYLYAIICFYFSE